MHAVGVTVQFTRYINATDTGADGIPLHTPTSNITFISLYRVKHLHAASNKPGRENVAHRP